MKKVVLVGGGDHAETIISLMTEEYQKHVVGYVDVQDRGPLAGIPYLGDDDSLEAKSNEVTLIIAFSYLGTHVDIFPRIKVINKYREHGFRFETVVSKNAIVHKSVTIQEGTIVFPGAIINQGVSIGSNCVINTGAIVEHNCVMGDNVQLGPGSIVCGRTQIHENSFIGAGSILRDGIIIGANVIIGMGTTVTGNILEQGTYFTKKIAG